MIISHDHRYVFVELAHTASTAISRELCECYDGQSTLDKHSTYHDFLKVATKDEKQYFTFSCIRNPMDIAVTKYFKFKTDHKNRWTDPVKVARRRGIAAAIDRRIFRFVHGNSTDFATFFKTFYRLPYNSWACLDHKQFDFVMRLENLEADFEETLRRIGVEPVRPLPETNVTSARSNSFIEYYDSPELIARAKRVFAIYLNEWGYEFPHEWGEAKITGRDRLAFGVSSFFFKLYWRHFKRWLWRNEVRSAAPVAPAAPGA